MSQLLERERTGYRVPVRRRSPLLDRSLLAAGALFALIGVYFQFAPPNWWLAHFSEVYHLASYVLGGLLIAAGLGVYSDRAMEEDGHTTTRVVAGVVLTTAAVAGAVIAALVWML